MRPSPSSRSSAARCRAEASRLLTCHASSMCHDEPNRANETTSLGGAKLHGGLEPSSRDEPDIPWLPDGFKGSPGVSRAAQRLPKDVLTAVVPTIIASRSHMTQTRTHRIAPCHTAPSCRLRCMLPHTIASRCNMAHTCVNASRKHDTTSSHTHTCSASLRTDACTQGRAAHTNTHASSLKCSRAAALRSRCGTPARREGGDPKGGYKIPESICSSNIIWEFVVFLFLSPFGLVRKRA